MIDVRGSRTDAADIPAGRYDFRQNPVLSRLPIYIALAIVAVVAYLRSAMPELRWPSRGAEAESEATATAEGNRIARVEELAVDETTAGAVEEAPADEASPDEDEPVLRNKSSNVVPFPIPSYRMIDSPPLQFAAFEPSRIDVPTPSSADWIAPAGGGTSAAGNTGGDGSSPHVEGRRNRAPEAGSAPRLNEAVAGAALLIGFDQLLAGARDADGDSLSIGAVRVSEGSIARTAEGFVYSSNAAAVPKDVVIVYEVTDGVTTIVKTAILPLVRGPLHGTPQGDILVGSDIGEQIDAGDSDDLIDARAGDDVILAGDGADYIIAGAGNDFVFAGGGDDVVFGGPGDDVVSGGEGDDRLHGDAGNDVLSGDAGDDDLHGGSGDDLLDGGVGSDRIDDGVGADQVMGGEGDDIVVAAMDTADDIYDGGEGNADVLDYSAATLSLALDLDGGQVTGDEVGTDRVMGFETALGGAADDIFTVGGQAVTLTGGDGDDRFVFRLPQGVDTPTLIHDILDFVAGDRINVSRFEVSFEQEDDREDRFERYYRDRDEPEDGRSALELRIRQRDGSDGEMTVFEFDGDGDFEFEMTIEVHGHHQPFLYETVTA